MSREMSRLMSNGPAMKSAGIALTSGIGMGILITFLLLRLPVALVVIEAFLLHLVIPFNGWIVGTFIGLAMDTMLRRFEL